jgi:uncharacterized protein with PQ loop repeat
MYKDMDNCTQISPTKTDVDIVFSVLVNIANVVGVLYNLPQMYHTYKRKTTNDISPIFLHARFWCSIMWIVYCLYYKFWYVFVSWIITGSSSTFMLYYMHIYPRINKHAQFLPVSTNDLDKEEIDDVLIDENKT